MGELVIPKRPKEPSPPLVVGCATIGPRDTLIRDVFATFHPLGRVKTRFFVRQGVKREVRSPRQSARGDFEFRPAPRDSITNRLLSSSVPSARLQNPFPRRIDPTYRSRRSEFFLRPATTTSPARPALQHLRRKPYFTIPSGLYRKASSFRDFLLPRYAPFSRITNVARSCLVID